MKKRYLVLLIVIATVMLSIGCSKDSSEEVTLATDKVIIDEDTKNNDKSKVKFDLVGETEPIDPGTIYNVTSVNDNIIQLTYENMGNIVNSLRIGTVSDEKNSSNQNKINWRNIDISGILYPCDYYYINSTRIKKDNKYYKIEKDGELKEIKSYRDLINKYGDIIVFGNEPNMDTNESYRNGTIDVVRLGDKNNPKIGIVDVVNDKYYTIPNEVCSTKEGSLYSVLGIEGDKIYIVRRKLDTEEGEDGQIRQKIENMTIGYVENNKFTKVLSSEDGVEIQASGDMIYENGRILFSGIAEGKNGIWNYDIENKKLKKIVDIEDDFFFEFYLNDTKDKVIISSRKILEEEERKTLEYTLSIANINDKLEISNITNILKNNEERKDKAFNGWGDNGTKFYIRSTVADENYNAISVYEIYKISE